GIAELPDDPRPEHERLNLFAIEHERQIVAGTDPVADAGFALDRRSRQRQIADVAVNRPFRDLQPAGDLRRRRHRAATAEQLDDLEEAIGAAHRAILPLPRASYCGFASTRPMTCPSGSSKTPSVTSGITVRGVTIRPPSACAFSSDAVTSAVSM